MKPFGRKGTVMEESYHCWSENGENIPVDEATVSSRVTKLGESMENEKNHRMG